MDYLEIENEMKKNYNAIVTKYEKEVQEDWKDKKYVDIFFNYLNENTTILDIACGTGGLSKYYNDKGFETTGIDKAKQTYKKNLEKIPTLLEYRKAYQKKFMEFVISNGDKQKKKDFEEWKITIKDMLKIYK